jgi:hypothetical protein
MGDRTRSALIVLFSAAAFALSVYACLLHRVLWVLVPLPGLIGLLYHVLSLQARYQNRANIAQQYRQFLADFHRSWGRPSPPMEVSEDGAEDYASNEPKFSSTFWAAAVLTAVLAIPASVSRGGSLLIGNQLHGGEEGLVFAGLGVYALVVLRTIGRLNSGQLHARFLMTSAMRATVALILGYFVGLTNYFPAAQNIAEFVVGLFYPLFVEALKDKAIELFTRRKPVTQSRELQMIDGIDDDVAGIFEELGIKDVQHMAASDPAVLSLRSLYPFERVVDWINQAMLIRRFGDKIAKLRELKMRGIVDWIPLMQPIVENNAENNVENNARAADAQVVLARIATDTEEPIEAIRIFGFAAYADYKTNLFWSLWQHRKDHFAAAADAVDETLRVSARLAARQYRATHKEMVMASSDDVNSSFTMAMSMAVDGTGLTLTSADKERKRAAYQEEFEKELRKPAQ